MIINNSWFRYPLRMALRNNFALELCVTDLCNLKCRYCCQATNENSNKAHMPLNDIKKVAEMVSKHEFFTIKISGGEPTLHPNFGEICQNLRLWFTAHHYQLATNGCNLLRYRNLLHFYDSIDLTLYPGLNDKTYNDILLSSIHTPDIFCTTRFDDELMRNVFKENNLGETNIFMKCRYPAWRKVVQGRIYPCSNIFGQAIRQKFNPNSVSVPMDENWRENLEELTIETHCQRCWVTVRHSPQNCRLL